MLITWMAYAMAFTAIVAGGAVALDHLAAIWDMPRRVVWFATLLLAGAIPLALALRPAAPVRAHEVIPVSAPAIYRPIVATRVPVAARQVRTVSTVIAPRRDWRMPPSWNRYAAFGWAVASLVLLALIARSFAALRRRRASWSALEVDGREVLITEDVGPAVVGALQPRIVIPAWVLALSPAERAMMLRHEAEHISAHDPALLLVGALIAALFPWNAALWLIVQRLRLTIEIDCDRRVLRAVANPREYGMMLLAVGARNGTTLPHTASLVERRRFLERRIVAMTTLRPSRPLVASLPFAAVVFVAAAALAQTPHPAPLVTAPARTAPLPPLPPRPSTPHALPVTTVAAPPPPPARSAAPAAPAAAPVAPAREEKHITAQWENAPFENVIEAFRKFTGRPFLFPERYSADLTISATVVDEPWDRALVRIMKTIGFEVLTNVPGEPADEIVVQPTRPSGAHKAPPAPASGEVPIEVLRAWIQQYQPAIIQGDTSVNFVTIVVDSLQRYLESRAAFMPHDVQDLISRAVHMDSIESVEVIKGPAAVAEYGPRAENGAVIIHTKHMTMRETPPDTAFSAHLKVTPFSTTAMETKLYVVDGKIVAPFNPLDKLGLDTKTISTLDAYRVGPGTIGPNAVDIMVVTLKR